MTRHINTCSEPLIKQRLLGFQLAANNDTQLQLPMALLSGTRYQAVASRKWPNWTKSSLDFDLIQNRLRHLRWLLLNGNEQTSSLQIKLPTEKRATSIVLPETVVNYGDSPKAQAHLSPGLHKARPIGTDKNWRENGHFRFFIWKPILLVSKLNIKYLFVQLLSAKGICSFATKSYTF